MGRNFVAWPCLGTLGIAAVLLETDEKIASKEKAFRASQYIVFSIQEGRGNRLKQNSRASRQVKRGRLTASNAQ